MYSILKKYRNREGFTLVELLIVIAIIAIIAAVAFVALDPLTRFRDSRDSARWQDVSAIANAIQVDQVDNGGLYLTAIESMATGSAHMIVDGIMTTGCDDQSVAGNCDASISNDGYCVDLSGLASEGYLGDVPVSPSGDVTWDDGSTNGDEGTGYTLLKNTNGSITVQACESENSTEISVTR